jgi:hypothetical protein
MEGYMRALIPLTVFVAVLAAQPGRAELVNGSFEPENPSFVYQLLPAGSTAIPGWTTTDTGVEWAQPLANGDSPAPAGLYVVDLANFTYSAGGVQQTVATQPGAVYVLEFRLGTNQRSGRDGTGEVVVAAASTTLSLRCLQNANLHFAFIDAATLSSVATAVPDTSFEIRQDSAWGTVKAMFR